MSAAGGDRLRQVVAKHVRRWTQSVRMDATGRFECPRHAGALTLSPGTCARLYQRGLDAMRGGDMVARIAVAPCIDCTIGARHAGCDHVAPASQPMPMPSQQLIAEQPHEVRLRRSKAGATASRESALTRKARP